LRGNKVLKERRHKKPAAMRPAHILGKTRKQYKRKKENVLWRKSVSRMPETKKKDFVAQDMRRKE